MPSKEYELEYVLKAIEEYVEKCVECALDGNHPGEVRPPSYRLVDAAALAIEKAQKYQQLIESLAPLVREKYEEDDE